MKKNCCEKCGKELGFLGRKHTINNDRIEIHYDSLCSDCYQVIKGGINQIETMYQRMIQKLKKDYGFDNMASVDIDTLIFLAVEAVMAVEPNYDDVGTYLNQTIINRTSRSVNPMEDMAKIVERIIDYGFSLNKKNAQLVDFHGYFMRTTTYLEQIGMNSSDDIPRSYHYLFLSCRGMIAKNMETGRVLSIPVEEDMEVEYTLRQENGVLEIFLRNVFYLEDANKNLVLSAVDEEQVKTIRRILDQFNEVANRRKDRRKRDTMTIIKRNVFRDLSKVQPETKTEDIALDCILLCVVKNLMNDPEGRKSELYDPQGLAIELLEENFEINLRLLGLNTREDILDFLTKNTLLAEGFNVRYEDANEKAWAFFTTKGYILCFTKTRKFIYIFEDQFPNDIYYPCNDLIYKGYRFLQLAENQESAEGSGDYRTFDGMIFYSENIELMGRMNRFFSLNNIFYVMDKYIEAETQVYRDRDSLMEVKRVTDRLFGDFSYLPFCQYDEWAAIREKMKEDDFLLSQLIDEKTGGRDRHPTGDTTYTIRIMDAFNRGARELNNALKFGDLSVAKGILWGYFNESLVDTLSREWVRVAGDIVREGDSLEDAFSKYFNMADIESDKAYYLGLFIYYLMDKMVLPADDFLENYERCVPVYKNLGKRILEEEEEPAPDLEFVKKEDIQAPGIVSEDPKEAAAEKASPDTGADEPAVEIALEDEGLKDPAEILAEKAAAEARVEKPIRRVIDDAASQESEES
ncbi:MAG: hypothetical protein VB030_04745 [Eubacterium aggregans]|uniref:hypothetical protein n=1 Tax=Eubacterium aggregans TaxID=81409 RepID=UPI002B21F972|nr:hypothetical protein [Eubacterium aggregans]MEA5073461.1 hypothetical protein [Eubacterium aggregans]